MSESEQNTSWLWQRIYKLKGFIAALVGFVFLLLGEFVLPVVRETCFKCYPDVDIWFSSAGSLATALGTSLFVVGVFELWLGKESRELLNQILIETVVAPVFLNKLKDEELTNILKKSADQLTKSKDDHLLDFHCKEMFRDMGVPYRENAISNITIKEDHAGGLIATDLFSYTWVRRTKDQFNDEKIKYGAEDESSSNIVAEISERKELKSCVIKVKTNSGFESVLPDDAKPLCSGVKVKLSNGEECDALQAHICSDKTRINPVSIPKVLSQYPELAAQDKLEIKIEASFKVSKNLFHHVKLSYPTKDVQFDIHLEIEGYRVICEVFGKQFPEKGGRLEYHDGGKGWRFHTREWMLPRSGIVYRVFELPPSETVDNSSEAE